MKSIHHRDTEKDKDMIIFIIKILWNNCKLLMSNLIMKYFSIILISLIFSFVTFDSHAQQKEKIILDKTKPAVFISFERVGEGEPIYANEEKERIWLRINNNTKWEIRLNLFSIGEENEFGIYHKIERENGKPLRENDPVGYLQYGDVRSPPSSLKSGKSILFSVPKNHLDEDLMIRIDFRYEWEDVEELSDCYSFPRNSVFFSASDLGKTIKSNFEKKVIKEAKKTLIIGHAPPNTKPIFSPQPEYPEAAKAVGALGEVTVEILIDENGNVEKAKAVSGHPLLKSAAENAALLARFKPITLSGVPVKVRGVIVFNFK